MAYPDPMLLHHERRTWILRYWTCSSRRRCNDKSENSIITSYGFHDYDKPILDSFTSVKSRVHVISLDIHLCRSFEGSSRGFSFQRKRIESPCLLCGCRFQPNLVEPPLLQKRPPEHCRNPFNEDAKSEGLQQMRLHSSTPRNRDTTQLQNMLFWMCPYLFHTKISLCLHASNLQLNPHKFRTPLK